MGGFLPSRRRFLGGAGAVVGLPFLESALPSSAWGQAPPAIERFMAILIPVGLDKRGWVLDIQSRDWTQMPSRVLGPLKASKVKHKIMLIDGLATVVGSGDHPSSSRSFLGACEASIGYDVAPALEVPGAISLDQLIARDALGRLTRIKSMQFGVYHGAVQFGVISYASDKQPLPPVGRPDLLFNQIFAGFDPGATGVEVARRRAYETSILDYAREEARLMSGRLGRSDRARMDAYLTEIRELEQRIAAVVVSATCAKPSAPPPSDAPLKDRVPLLFDLALLAFQCDATRVITFSFNHDNDGHAWLGAPEGHHDLSHWGNDVTKQDKAAAVEIWELGEINRFYEKMDAVAEGNGKTMLDGSLVICQSECAEGNNHSPHDNTMFVAGNLGGKLPTGRYARPRGNLPPYKHKLGTGGPGGIPYGTSVPTGRYFVNVANAFGVPITRFGSDGDRALTPNLDGPQPL